MRLSIVHVTSYEYQRPVELLSHRMMLTPRNSQSLRLISTDLQVSPHAGLEWTTDVFGNIITTASFDQPSQQLMIVSETIVEQCAPLWPILKIAPHAHHYPFEYERDDLLDLGTLLTPSAADPDARVATWATAFVRAGGTDTLALLQEVNGAIHAGFVYAAREAHGTQSPHATLDLGSGSCRDLATLFIEAVRHLGFAARAVSGYLFEPSPDVDAAGGGGQHGATHAWAEVFLPCAGWIAFDPTNGRMGEAHLVPVAVGRTIEQLSPVEGRYAGAADMMMSMDVRVTVAAVDQLDTH